MILVSPSPTFSKLFSDVSLFLSTSCHVLIASDRFRMHASQRGSPSVMVTQSYYQVSLHHLNQEVQPALIRDP